MTVYQFVEYAGRMRMNGGIPSRGLEVGQNIWGKLSGFSIKHPDSTRTRKARQLGQMRKATAIRRELKGEK